MIVIRNKFYSTIPQPGDMVSDGANVNAAQQGNQQAVNQQTITSRALTLEQLKFQRQQVRLQHAKEMARQEEEMTRMRQLAQMQKMEKQKEDAEQKNQIRITENEDDSNDAAAKNANLYKTKSKIVPTVGMPK